MPDIDLDTIKNRAKEAMEEFHPRAVLASLNDIDTLIADLKAARTENEAIAAWQCPFLPSTRGLTNDECGHQFCNIERERDQFRAEWSKMTDYYHKAEELNLKVEKERDQAREALRKALGWIPDNSVIKELSAMGLGGTDDQET